MIPKRFRPAVLFVIWVAVFTVLGHTFCNSNGALTWPRAAGISLALVAGSVVFTSIAIFLSYWAFGK